MNFLNIDSIQEHALLVTEKLCQALGHDFDNKQKMSFRAKAYPQIFEFFTEENLQDSQKFFDIVSKNIFEKSQPKDYVFGQRDIKDGLAAYSKTQEFDGLCQSFGWPDGGERNKEKILQELYRCVLHYMNKDTYFLKITPLHTLLSYVDNQKNEKIFIYHAKRISDEILKKNNIHDVEKRAEDTDTLDIAFTELNDLLEQARQYREAALMAKKAISKP